MLLLLCAIFATFVSCNNNAVAQNNTLGLEDATVDATVKAALENASVSEVVVRKDLLLFPVNAPNLVCFTCFKENYFKEIYLRHLNIYLS